MYYVFQYTLFRMAVKNSRLCTEITSRCKNSNWTNTSKYEVFPCGFIIIDIRPKC